MQNIKASYVKKVISMFVSGRYSAATERRVGIWLTNGKESKAKNEALDCVWQESLAEADCEDADEHYNRW